MSIRVFLCDDHELVAAGLRALLSACPNVEVIGEGRTVEEAARLVRRLRPDVVLMDYDLGPGQHRNGVDGVAAVTEGSPHTKVVMLTQYDDHRIVIDALRSGAAGYVLKSASRDELLAAIRMAHEGGALLSPGVQRRVVNELSERSAISDVVAEQIRESLTDREHQVLKLLCRGLANAEIAEELHVSVSTVKTYLKSIFEKFHAADRVQVAVAAVARGIVSFPELKR